MSIRWKPMGTVALLGAALTVGAVWTGCTGDPDPFTSKKTTSQGGNGQGGDGDAGKAEGGNGTGGDVDICPGGTICNDVCTQTDFDPNNCGACGTKCAEGEVCSMGQCGLQCSGGTTKCGDLCVNIANNPAHCGQCDNACAEKEVCANGTCGLTCEEGGGTNCSGICVNTDTDVNNCGACANVCPSGEVCIGGACQLDCVGGTTNCGGNCVDTNTDPANCGTCGNVCKAGDVCSQGGCNFERVCGMTNCSNICVDTNVDPNNCGACANACKADEVCTAGACKSVCGGGLTKCGNFCVDTQTDKANCGSCGNICKSNEDCTAGVCVACDTNTTDCDGDGWKVADGDCCDVPGSCGANPELVNPGAIEVIGNGLDDNCNGKLDLFDLEDTVPCDTGLASDTTDPNDFAKALGVCRTTLENPQALKDKTWGLIQAEIMRADGSALADNRALSLRSYFGKIAPATLEGQRAVVMSSGIASDSNQTNPGPIAASQASNPSTTHNLPAGSSVNISTCNDPYCIKDWFSTANGTLKKANELPVAPNCGSGNVQADTANDSVMIRLRLRAPTNARAFSFNSYFMSSEYPEYVCTTFNDQFIALVTTAQPTSPIPNPVDKNLMVFNDGKDLWPVGINVAHGTSLFSVCDSQMAKPNCWDNDISAGSCFLGASQLVDTGFGVDTNNPNSCTHGGGTFWLTTSGNINPGEVVELRFAIWDVGDSAFDSLAVIDGFKWLANATLPGTDN